MKFSLKQLTAVIETEAGTEKTVDLTEAANGSFADVLAMPLAVEVDQALMADGSEPREYETASEGDEVQG